MRTTTSLKHVAFIPRRAHVFELSCVRVSLKPVSGFQVFGFLSFHVFGFRIKACPCFHVSRFWSFQILVFSRFRTCLKEGLRKWLTASTHPGMELAGTFILRSSYRRVGCSISRHTFRHRSRSRQTETGRYITHQHTWDTHLRFASTTLYIHRRTRPETNLASSAYSNSPPSQRRDTPS